MEIFIGSWLAFGILSIILWRFCIRVPKSIFFYRWLLFGGIISLFYSVLYMLFRILNLAFISSFKTLIHIGIFYFIFTLASLLSIVILGFAIMNFV